MYASAAADDLLPLVQQAQVLAMQFDAVVANPPYMGHIISVNYMACSWNDVTNGPFSCLGLCG
jgi:hypothetical protein